MDIDATQVIDDISLDVAEEKRKDGCPVGFLKLLKQKNFEEKLIPIFEGINRIGRDVACHVTLESKTLSKEHCCIEVVCDNHFIYDLGSSNKSRRNKMVLMPNVRYELNNNDTLTLADLKLVYIKSPAVHVGDSGSDTESLPESESMLQVSGDGVGVAFEPQTDDDDDDDPSSDILHPTQHAGSHLIGLHNKMHAFVEDSFQHVTSENKEKESFADETVLETPPRVVFGADSGADFVPESDSEAEADTQPFFKPTTLEHYSTDIEKEVKPRAVASDEPTQTYSMDFVNETIAVERSGSPSKSTSVAEESPVLNDADIAPTQVFDASVQKSDSENALAEVFSRFPVEKLVSSTSSVVQSKTDSSQWKATDQESIACNTDVEETQVVEETAFPITIGDWKTTEKLDVNQAVQMYVDETQMYADESAAVIQDPPLIDKPQSQKDKIVRESISSVINFSPQSASTQVFSSDADTSFLPTLVLETSDRLDPDDNLVLPPFPATAISLSSLNLVRCTGLNSERSPLSTEDVCTQVFSGKEMGQISVEPTADDLCTQVYEDIDWHLGGSGEAVAKSSTFTDDICTQVYLDRDRHLSDSGEATAKSSACNVVSESAVTEADGKTVEERDLDNTDELATETFDIPSVEQKSKEKRCKEAAEPNAEYLLEGKKVSAEDSVGFEVSGSWSATKKTTDQKQRRNSKLSSRRTTLMQSNAESINPDEETKGHSSNGSDQPFNDSPEKKRNVTKQSREKQIDTKKIMNSDVSDNSKNSDDIYSEKGEMETLSKASGRRTSMRQNKGKRPEDNEFLKPSEEKRKNKKGSKRQAEELQPSGVESPNKKICSDPEEAPLISKSSSEGLDSQSSRGTRSSEVVDSSQLSDDDLPSLDSLIALNRVQGTATRNALSKSHEPRFAMIAEVENVQPVGELESEEEKIFKEIDLTEDEIMKKESGNKKKTSRGSERNQRTEAKISEEDSSVEGNNDPTTDETTKKESGNKKKMNLGSKKSQRPEKKLLPEDDVLLEEKNYLKKPGMTESGNKKTTRVGSKNQRTDETTKMHSEDDSVEEKKKADGGRSCDSASERDLSEGAVDVKAGQKRSRRAAAGQKQMFSDSVAEDRVEVNEKSYGRERWKNAKKPVTEKSVVKEHEGIFSAVVDVPVRSEKTDSSKDSHLSSEVATLTKGDSKLSGDLEMEPGPSTSTDHSSKGRRTVRTAVTTEAKAVVSSIQRKSRKPLAANTDANDENLMDNDNAIELMTSGSKSRSTLAADLNVVKEKTEEVKKRSGLRKKSLGALVAEFEDDLASKEVNEDLQKEEPLQPLKELETDSAVEETKRTARDRKRITESELSALTLRKKVKNAAAADNEETEDEKMSNSEIKLLTSAKKTHRAGASDLDEKVMIESSKELERKRVDGTKSNRVCAGEVLDSHDVEKSIDVKKSVTRKSCRGLFPENDDKAMKKLSGSGSSSLDKINDKLLETEDADEKVDRPESKLSTKKTNRRTLAAEKNVDGVGRTVTATAKPVRVETGSRRGKKTEPRVEEELPNERHEAASEATSGKKNSRNLTTSEGVLSNEKPQVHVVEEVSEQRLEGTGRKRKNYNILNENDKKDAAKVKIDLGVDSKRSRISGKPVKEDSRSNEASSHLKPDEQITTPDLAKGARRRTKSGLEPVIKPKVMFTGVVDENGQKCSHRDTVGQLPGEEQLDIQTFESQCKRTVKSLGGEMVESIYDCTHLVTDQVRRTVKFLCGVARGLSIVSPKWLEDSRSAGRFLDPSGFLVSDVENEKKFNFSLEQTLKEAAKRPLLLGLSIHVTENVRPDPTQMKDIINCAGGKFVQELSRSFEDNLIIVTCDGKDLESCRRLEELGIPLVSSEYIMTGILQHKLDANLFRLTTKKTPETSKRNKPETFSGSRKKQKK